MIDYLIMGLAALGAAFILLAAIGILRMPDLYLRISVTTKAATLGTGLILSSVALYFGEAGISTRIVAIILFTLLTAPVGAHLIGRASYFTGVPIWKHSVVDDLKGRYQPDVEGPDSGPSAQEEQEDYARK
jgi:multicomponent Na+:H+ antiporter subunit G